MKDSFGKGTKRPYIVHPIEVADIVTTMTRDPEVICAAVLHDTIEDCAGVTKETLEDRFGERVAMLVDCESEDKSKSWEERKSTTIRRLRTAPREVQMIGLADKLSNMRDIHRDYPVFGENLWMRFRMQSKAAMGWYYKSIRDVLKKFFFKARRTYEEILCACGGTFLGKRAGVDGHGKKRNVKGGSGKDGKEQKVICFANNERRERQVNDLFQRGIWTECAWQ